MIKLSNYLYEKSSLIICFVLTVIVFSYLYFVLIDAAKCFEVTGADAVSLGTSFGYSYEKVKEFYSIRSKDMIACYLELNLIWDNIFAILYGLMYLGWLSLSLKPFAHKFKSLNLLPIVHVILDWLENAMLAGVSKSVLAEQQISMIAVKVASIFTMMKWVTAMLVFILIVIAIILRIKKWFKKRSPD